MNNEDYLEIQYHIASLSAEERIVSFLTDDE